MTGFTPTGEQLDALDAFKTGRSLKIEAGAGTGKTATLRLLAESTDRRGQYVAFNKAIVTEAGEKMPRNVACNTAHSLAFRAVGKRYAHRLKSPRMSSIDLANRLGLSELRVTAYDDSAKTLSRTFLAGLAMRAVGRFCQTADPEPTRFHVPWVEGLDAPDGVRATAKPCNQAIAKHIESAMQAAWVDLQDPSGSLPFKHEHYLKMYQLGEPRIDADFILFDEAQDANPVMVAIVAAQTHAQVVWVGDSQQEIYAWAGAQNALATMPADATTFLTQSFRFGPAIADAANTVLETIADAKLRLTGTESIDSRVGPVVEPDTILTRTNATAVRAIFDSLAEGGRPHLVGGGRDIISFAEAAEELQSGGRTGHPELACFDSWADVQDYVEHDEQGGDLRLLVTLVDEFGPRRIADTLKRMPREENATLIVSTAHKSKGREWSSVRLASDFQITEDGESRLREGDEERRLLYVAVTRARLRLDVGAISLLSDNGEPETPTSAETTAGRETAGESDGDAVARVRARGASILAAMATAGLLHTDGPDDVAEAERRMQQLEAEGDRAGTIREERAKHAARRRMESV